MSALVVPSLAAPGVDLANRRSDPELASGSDLLTVASGFLWMTQGQQIGLVYGVSHFDQWITEIEL